MDSAIIFTSDRSNKFFIRVNRLANLYRGYLDKLVSVISANYVYDGVLKSAGGGKVVLQMTINFDEIDQHHQPKRRRLDSVVSWTSGRVGEMWEKNWTKMVEKVGRLRPW